MKKLIIGFLCAISTLLTQAQVYKLDSLSLNEVLFIKNATIQLSSDTTFWDNDTLIATIRNINTQVAQKRQLYNVTVNKKVLTKLIGNAMGGLWFQDFDGILQERKRAKEQLENLNVRIKIIRSIRDYEEAKKIPKKRSIFEQLNTGFLDKNNFKKLE